MLNYLLIGITYGFIAGVQPGPLQTYIISETLKKGWRSTIPAAFAPVISDIPIFVLIIFLLTSVPANFIIVLRILGGLFLLYLSYSTFRTWSHFEIVDGNTAEPNKSLYNAVIVNLLNPNPYLGWSLILGPPFLEGWNIAPSYGVSLVAGFYTTIIFFLGLTIFLFSFAREFGSKISKLFFGLSAIALLGFALYQLWIGFKSIIG